LGLCAFVLLLSGFGAGVAGAAGDKGGKDPAPAVNTVTRAAVQAQEGESSLDEPGVTAAQRLAARYVPLTMLREEKDPPCETSAEQYEPTTVHTMLGNPTVTLQKYVEGGGLEDITKAPTVEEIAGLKGDHYMNLRGEALGDTCVYAKDFQKLLAAGKAPPVTYAHIAREPNHTGFALQYWFFWYFNQFNDLHEGDWEGMQLTFGAETAAAALDEEPSEIILFQHAGGERSKWEDSKVQKEGSHPIVYPAAGSHATFYDSAVYVENGQGGSGVGCDNTSEPLREVRPTPVLIPETAPEEGPFAWLSYRGRWGEREKGFNNGPTGPVTKTVWREPFSWMEKQRSTSPRLPGGTIAGPQVTKAFCGAVAAASELINLDAQSPLAATLTVVILAAILVLLIGITRWRPVDIEHPRKKRAFGQLVRAARQMYGRNVLYLVPIAIAGLLIVGGFNLLANIISTNHDVDNTNLRLALADILAYVSRPIGSALAAAVVTVFVRELVEHGRRGVRSSWGGTWQRKWRLIGGQLLATMGVTLMAITVIGLPWAIWKYFGWQFVQQEIVFEDKPLRAAFRDSSELVRGSWWKTVRVAGFFWLISIVTGPMIGFGLIFLNFSLFWINVIGSAVFALLIPYVALGHTLLYFDLQERAATEPVKPKRSWRLWRPRQFGRIVRPAPLPAEA
jgi:hypothetical protein